MAPPHKPQRSPVLHPTPPTAHRNEPQAVVPAGSRPLLAREPPRRRGRARPPTVPAPFCRGPTAQGSQPPLWSCDPPHLSNLLRGCLLDQNTFETCVICLVANMYDMSCLLHSFLKLLMIPFPRITRSIANIHLSDTMQLTLVWQAYELVMKDSTGAGRVFCFVPPTRYYCICCGANLSFKACRDACRSTFVQTSPLTPSWELRPCLPNP